MLTKSKLDLNTTFELNVKNTVGLADLKTF